MDFRCIVTFITSSWPVYILVCLKTQVSILQTWSFILKIFLRPESSLMLTDPYRIFIYRKEKKNNLLWAASLYFWSEMNSQIKGYISSLPCDTKSDFKSLLLVQSDLEAEEVTLCKTVCDTHRCCALVLCKVLNLELFLVWQKTHHNVWLLQSFGITDVELFLTLVYIIQDEASGAVLQTLFCVVVMNCVCHWSPHQQWSTWL